ncbi:histidine phosphatase family protein [Pedococcus sp. NPDC057267]|uniref:histidine phosphatase family protein n=1 Tax=Pedococcus sp. NPDC057267 TaxID=3346077 RepID=UPI00362FE8F4
MPVVQVHLVRHGESTWNREGRLQGQTIHPPLTARGLQQASAAATTVADLLDAPAMLWSSDLLRAARTASVIGRHLRLPVHHEESLREQHLGTMEGRLARHLRPQPTPSGRHVADVRWGGGESVADVYRRVGRFLRRELASASECGARHLVAVSHGDTIRVATAWLAGRDHRNVDWKPLPNGSVTTVSVDPWCLTRMDGD